jgi:hypothetical protein
MEEYSPELLKYQRCADIHGNAVQVTVGRRNGTPAVFLRPDHDDFPSFDAQGQNHD